MGCYEINDWAGVEMTLVAERFQDRLRVLSMRPQDLRPIHGKCPMSYRLGLSETHTLTTMQRPLYLWDNAADG